MSLSREEFDKIYLQGYDDYYSPKGKKKNPYDFNTERDKYTAWSTGWIDADMRWVADHEGQE